MEEPKHILTPGTRIVTHDVLGSIAGMLVKPQHLENRRANAPGVIGGWVPGHGGDVYWVSHDNVPGKPIAVYGFTEFELDLCDFTLVDSPFPQCGLQRYHEGECQPPGRSRFEREVEPNEGD